MSNKYYVYALIDPRTNNPFYIGKGSGKRCYAHLTQTLENTDNKFKFKVIMGMRKYGIEPIVEKIQENLLEDEAYELEEKLIKQYGRIVKDKETGILTNICEGLRPPDMTGIKRPYRSYEETMGVEKAAIRKRQTKQRMIGNSYGFLEGEEAWNKGKAGTYHFKNTENMSKAYWEHFNKIGHGNRKGSINSVESNKKRSSWNKENKWEPPEETKIKKGHKWTPEQIAKRIETRKRRAAEKRKREEIIALPSRDPKTGCFIKRP